MARLYANENFPFAVVEVLRELGHDVLTVREAGNDNQRIDDAGCWPTPYSSSVRSSPSIGMTLFGSTGKTLPIWG